MTERPTGLVVGFTGTRQGMTNQQEDTVYKLLRDLEPTLFRHGDCYGADEAAHELAIMLDIPVAIHPATGNKRANAKGARFVYKPKSPLTQNQDIVDNSSVLIATPASKKEVLRSGTWATVRAARKRKRIIAVVYPDGSMLKEGNK